MKLQSRKAQPEEYTISGAARVLGMSVENLRLLELKNVVHPRRIQEGKHEFRLYSRADIDSVLEHYRREGGLRVRRKKNAR